MSHFIYISGCAHLLAITDCMVNPISIYTLALKNDTWYKPFGSLAPKDVNFSGSLRNSTTSCSSCLASATCSVSFPLLINTNGY